VLGVRLLLTPRKGGLASTPKAAALLLKGPAAIGPGRAVRGLRPLCSRGPALATALPGDPRTVAL
jgi:hypothetical protein